jgi:hypothetical protein
MTDQSATEKVDGIVTGKSRWRSCLLTAVIAIFAVILAAIIAVRFFAGSGPKTVKAIPANFPASLVLYRPENVKSIVYYPASEKSKPLSFALLPIQMLSGASPEAKQLADHVEKGVNTFTQTDTVSLTWLNVRAKPDDVLRFYVGSFVQAGMADPQIRQTSDKDVTELKGVGDGLSADLLITTTQATSTVDSLTLVVEYRPAATSTQQ